MYSRSLLEKKWASYSLFLCLKPPCPSYLSKPYQVITVMNGGLMTLTSTLFKGSRIKDGIWTCNNAGGVMVAGMAGPSISVIVLLIRHWELCSNIISQAKLPDVYHLFFFHLLYNRLRRASIFMTRHEHASVKNSVGMWRCKITPVIRKIEKNVNIIAISK